MTFTQHSEPPTGAAGAAAVTEPDGLPGDTGILTRNGRRALRDIRVGDLVLTHTGAYAEVTGVERRTAEQPLLNVRVAYDDRTPDGAGVTLAAGQDVWANVDPDPAGAGLAAGLRWVRADALKPGDVVAAPRPEGPWVDRDHIDLAEYADPAAEVTDTEVVEVHTNVRTGQDFEVRLPRRVRVDADFCTLFGRLTTQATPPLHKTGVCAGTKITAALVEKVWAVGTKQSLNDLHPCRAVRAFYADAWNGRRPWSVGLPVWMLHLPEPKRRALLEGLWPAGRAGKWANLHTRSPRLAGHVQSLLRSLGLPGARASIPGRTAVVVGGEWEVRTTPRFAEPDPRYGFVDERYVYLRVRSVEAVAPGPVCSITVPGAGSYVTTTLAVRQTPRLA